MRLTAALLLVTGPLYGAEIIQLTSGPFQLIKGDILTLEVDASEEALSVEWWSEGKVICDRIRCDVDTATFTPGENYYDVVVKDDVGVAIDRVVVRADPAPPLYRPEKVRPRLSAPGKNYVRGAAGQWLAVARAGFVARVEADSRRRLDAIHSLGLLLEGATYKVPEGSQLILRQIAQPREWLVMGPAEFQLRKGLIELHDGRAVLRQTSAPDSPPQEISGTIHNLKIRAEGSVFVEMSSVSKGDERKINLRHYSGSALTLECRGGETRTLEQLSALTIEARPQDPCGGIAKAPLNDPDALVRQWMPWWLDGQNYLPSDRWRAEVENARADVPLSEAIAAGKSALSRHECAEFMDLAAHIRKKYHGDLNFMAAVSACLVDLRLMKSALFHLRALEAGQYEPGWTAFMIGRALAGQGAHKRALDWYDIAERRQFNDRALLARHASESAEAARMSTEKLRWLETWAMFETDAAAVPDRWRQARAWNDTRSEGAEVRALFLMDGQALPVNSKKSAALPGNAPTARSTVMDFSGRWFSQRDFAGHSSVVMNGSHTLKRPTQSELSAGQSSVHELSGGIKVTSEGSRRAATGGGVMVGTGISGNERQRDLLGWYLESAVVPGLRYKVRVDARKYLDPNPGGSDEIDLDLNRVTGLDDHSHLDNGVLFSVDADHGDYAWIASARVQSVDYRVSTMDQYDHLMTDVEARFLYMTSPASQLILRPRVMTRNFAKARATESLSCIDVDWSVKTEPLWSGHLIAGYEVRGISDDDTSSYTRHYYGFGLNRDF
jgi:hypothetical protein